MGMHGNPTLTLPSNEQPAYSRPWLSPTIDPYPPQRHLEESIRHLARHNDKLSPDFLQ